MSTHPRRWLALPFSLYLFLSIHYLLVVPLGESPDEPGHLQCIEQVAERGRLPVVEPPPDGGLWHKRGVTRSGRMCYHMPLYYLLSGATVNLTQRALGQSTSLFAEDSFPADNPDFIQFVEGAHQPFAMFLHRPDEEALAINLLRGFALVLGLATLAAAGIVAARLFPAQPWAPILAMTLVAGWPQFLFLSRAISNDGLALALGAGVLATLVASERPVRFVWAAGLAALAVLSKLSLLFVVGVVLVALAVDALLHCGWQRPIRRGYLRVAFGVAAMFAAFALLITLQPTLRAHFLRSSDIYTANRSPIGDPAYWRNVAALTFSSGWARFGWMNLPAPAWQSIVWWAVLGAASLGGALLAVHGATTPSARSRLLVSAFWFSGVVASYASVILATPQPQFRFLLPLVPILAALAAAGLLAPLPARARSLLVLATALILLAANLWLLFALLVPAYAL